MILLDDSFASIIKAVEQGRGVYANVKKMVTYIFSHNMAELFPFVFAALGGVGLVPLGALQVLSIDLGSDVLPGLALGTEHPEPGVMKQPPRARARAPPEPGDAQARRLHRRHPVGLGGLRLSLRAALARLDLGRRDLDGPRNPHYLVYREAITMTQAAIVAVPGRQRLRLPHRARVAVQGRRLQQQVAGLRPSRRHCCIMAAISYVPFLQNILKTGPLSAARLGIPRRCGRLFVLRRRSEKMVRCAAGRRVKEGEAMHVIIVGCGRVGASTAAELEPRAATASSSSTATRTPFRLLPRNFAGTQLRGHGFDREVLEEAGIREADAPRGGRPSGDNTNTVAARVAKEVYRVPDVVARIFDPQRADIYRRYGVQTFAPTAWSVEQDRRVHRRARDLEREIAFGNGEVQLMAAWVPAHLVGKPVNDLARARRDPRGAHRAQGRRA